MKRINWIDTAKSIELPGTLHKDARDFLDGALASKDSGTYLQATWRATHSGHLIPHRVYTGWGMKKGCSTWFCQDKGGSAAFDKPVLLNHDAHGPVFGRVVMATFTQLKQGKDFEDDWKKPDSGTKHGSGYITTTTDIVDADAAQKVMDGRFYTVSTRQRPKDAWCSVCGLSFMEGCDHELGEYYESEDGASYMCYAVTGELEYQEMSFVALPNQPNAIRQSINQIKKQMEDGAKDEILVVQCFADSAASIVSMRVGSQKNLGVMADLSAEKLPSLGDITGKVQVSMSTPKKDEAPPGVELKTEKPGAAVEPVKDAAKDETQAEKTPTFDFGFCNLARSWKDVLDLSKDIKESSISRGTIIPAVDEVKSAIKSIEDKIADKSLTDEQVKGLFGGEVKVQWTDELFKTSLRLLPYLKDEKRVAVYKDMFDAGLFPDKTEDDMDKDLREKLLKDAVEEKDRLRVEKETVQKQLADAVALADTRQKDLDKVLKDNVDLKAALLKNKALTIVKLDARKTGETLDEGQINTRVDELLKKEDENKIDESLTARIMSMSVSQDPGKGAGADKLVADAKATPAASTGERKNEDKKVSDKVETQSLEHLDKMADMAFPGTDS